MSPAVRALLASLALSSAVAVLPSGGCLEPSAATEAHGRNQVPTAANSSPVTGRIVFWLPPM